jgi:hypothetical protein
MALKAELMACGFQAEGAKKLGFDSVTNFTAAGSTQATATAMTANCGNVTTSSANSGVKLNGDEQPQLIYNAGPQVLTVYAPTSPSGSKFIGLSSSTGVQLASGKTLLVMPVGTTLFYNISA